MLYAGAGYRQRREKRPVLSVCALKYLQLVEIGRELLGAQSIERDRWRRKGSARRLREEQEIVRWRRDSPHPPPGTTSVVTRPQQDFSRVSRREGSGTEYE